MMGLRKWFADFGALSVPSGGKRDQQKPTLIDRLVTTTDAGDPAVARGSWRDSSLPTVTPPVQNPPALADPAYPVEISAAEQQANGDLAFALTMLGVTAVGRLAFPPLLLVDLPAVLYVGWRSATYAYQAWRKKGQITAEFVDAGLALGIIVSGYYGLAFISFTMTSLSRKLLARTEDRSRKSLINVFGQQPRTVWVMADGVEVEVSFAQLQVGDTLIIGAGQMIAADGVVCGGAASVDQHILTGEAKPVEKGVGDAVFAGTLVLMGKIYVQVEKAGAATTAAQIGAILNQTVDYKQQIQTNSELLSNKAALPTLALGLIALPLVGLNGALGVFESSIGYGLRLTGPIGMLNYLRIAARQGILIKDGRSLELLQEIDTVVFDKTGTLTQEQPQIQAIHTFAHLSEDAILAYAAAAEARLSHPIAHAIVDAADARALTLPHTEDAHYQVGYGIQVKFADCLVHVGSERFMTMTGIGLPPAVLALQSESHALGHSLVMVAVDQQLAGAIVLQPTLRPEIKTVIANLQARGLTLYILSGDQEQPTQRLAETLGIDHYQANTLPEQKAAFIEALQRDGHKVCFVGDGINDAIALKKANVSVSLRGATTVATDSAQIVLMNGSLQHLPVLFHLAADFDSTMRTNNWLAVAPGIFAIGGVFLWHFGFLSAALIYTLSLLAGSVNAMLPALADRPNSHHTPLATLADNLASTPKDTK
ncbi:MAG: heavy metal translocating P-type ATPase [Caldilineaceae bacterium]